MSLDLLRNHPRAVTMAGILSEDRGDSAENQMVQAYWKTMQSLMELVGMAAEMDRSTLGTREESSSIVLGRLRESLLRGSCEKPGGDLLVRVIPLLEEVFGRIVENPRTTLARRYENLPAHKVRSQDTRCLVKLARAPGRTVMEKVAQSHRVPAVVRYESVDTPENRLIRRLALEVHRALKARRAYEEKARGPEWVKEVWEPYSRELEKSCRRILQESPLGELPPSVLVEPNNALLGDPDYSKAFRIFRAFRRLKEVHRRGWVSVYDHLLEGFAWSLQGLLAIEEGVIAGEEILRPRYLGEGDIESGGDVCLFERRTGEALFFRQGPRPAVLQLKVEKGAVLLEMKRLERKGASGLMELSGEKVGLRIHLEASETRMAEKSRGYPLDVFVEGLDGELLEVLETAGDWRGLVDVANEAMKCLGFSEIRKKMSRDEETARASEWGPYLGVELGGTRVKVCNAEGVQHGELFVAASYVEERLSEEGTRETGLVLSGDQGGRAWSLEGKWKKWGRTDFFGDVFGENESLSRELSAAMGASFRSENLLEKALALVVEDDLDEVTLQQVRRSLPVAGEGRWLVWRSVAAAMAWREEMEGNRELDLREGDMVLVLDMGPQRTVATPLSVRRDQKHQELYWERPGPLSLENGKPLSTFNWEMALADELLKEVGELDEDFQEHLRAQVLNEVELGALTEGDWLEAPGIFEGKPYSISIEVKEALLEKAKQAFLDAFQPWAKELKQSGLLEELKGRAKRESGRLFLLPLGFWQERGDLGEELWKELGLAFEGEKLLGGPEPEWADLPLRGGKTFLERYAKGLPTWRDLIPNLSLLVGRGRNQQEIALLSSERFKGGVAPGQRLVYRIEETLVLPKGADYVEMPLQSSRGDREEVEEFLAFIDDESFPLSRDVEVELRVSYRYAEDAFQLFLRQKGGEGRSSGSFDEILVQWKRGGRMSEAQERVRERKNEPLEFPRPRTWEGENMDSWLWELQQNQETTEVHLKRWSNKSELRSRLSNKHQALNVVNELEETRKALKEARRALKELMPIGRAEEGTPQEVEVAFKSWATRACGLARIPLEHKEKRGRIGGRDPREGARDSVPKMLRREKSSDFEKKFKEIEIESLRLLGLLRHRAPQGFLATLKYDVEQQNEGNQQAWLEALGRGIGNLSEANRQAIGIWFVARCLEMIDQCSEQAEIDTSIQHWFWALTTMLWSHEENLLVLDQEKQRRLWDGVRGVLEKVQESWLQEGVSSVIYEEAGLVVLALLRLRKKEGMEWLDAGEAEPEAMADLLEGVGEELMERYELRPRVSFDGGEGDQEYPKVLAANLRGYRSSRIEIREKEEN